MKKELGRILVTGALGQIGSELTVALRDKYGIDNVIASDIKDEPHGKIAETGNYFKLDVTNRESLANTIKDYKIDSIFHLAALLSATGERNPELCWDVNMNGLMNVLAVGVEFNLNRIIVPSSIAVFGKYAERENTPQESILQPSSMYGVTKVAGERLCDYFVQKYSLDCRGLRFPGIISSETLPGGGTTDYAVEIYYEAIKNKKYECFLSAKTELPMMYMPDCIRATMMLAEADFDRLVHHSDFNLAAMSFDPETIAESIKKYIPEFEMEYKPDYRQAIADSWPQSIDDGAARKEWDWAPEYDIDSMTRDMLEKLGEKHKLGLI